MICGVAADLGTMGSPVSAYRPTGFAAYRIRRDVMLQRVDLGEVPYEHAVEQMAGWVDERQQGLAEDRLFLLSHPPVITYGPRTAPADLPPPGSGIQTVQVDRGGFATYHGPGQLVGYLVVSVRERGPVDIVRWLETGLVAALAELGFRALRRDTPHGSPSLVGVWTFEGEKIASIGMRIRGGVTSHGFALNVDPDMSAFEHFTACGLHDVTMTSLAREAERQGTAVPSETAVRTAVAAALGVNHQVAETPDDWQFAR
ncbi:MAG TPA: lipoyl(octanoyl) transferase LipB [Actinopolymorphaceae bacterium]|nr:lipoyl(octanoyl) transferase LipB [Actinopolymorphaceae bacterium]